VKREDWILVVAVAAVVLGVDFLLRSRWSPARLFFKYLERAQADAFRYRPGDLLRAIVRVACWTAFLVASAVLIALLAGVGPPSEVGIGPIILAILLWLALLIMILLIFVRYRQMERRAMLWSLAVAAEKEIPLASAVRAFAEERHDGLGYRARLLAEALEQGVPLDQALEQSYMLLPSDAMVAVHTGCQTGTLASMLRSVVRNAATLDAAVQAAVARVVYLVTFIFFAAYLNVFLAVRIIPAFIKIFQDFKVTGGSEILKS
jgi:protein transport protein HofC